MAWLIYFITGLMSVGLVLNLVLQFYYRSATAPRWQLVCSDFTALMLCFSLLVKGTP